MGADVVSLVPLEIGNVCVGWLAGAWNTATLPENVSVPQLGLQVEAAARGVGVAPSGNWVVWPATGCITAHCGSALAGETFKNEAVNCTCCAGCNSVGTVAVAGDIETRMPVSSVSVAVPVFFVAASAAAVNVIVGIGFGKFDSEGAVYVRTLLGAVGVVVQVPIAPVPPCILSPLLQFFTVCCVGFGTVVVGASMYT